MSKEVRNKTHVADDAIAAIDLHALLVRYLKKWYWFVLSGIVWLSLGVLYILCKNPEFQVSSTVMIRTEENKLSAIPGIDMLQSFGFGGGGRVVESELYILNSQTLMGQVIDDLDIQTRYRKKKGMRYIEQYPSSDVRMVYPPLFTDTMNYHLRFVVSKRANDYKVRFKYGRKLRDSFIIKDLSDSVSTPVGTFRFKECRALEEGDKMKINILPKMSTIEYFRENLQAGQVEKSLNVLELSTITSTPQKAIDMIELLIELYNQDSMTDKRLMTQSTGTFIDERLRLITEELASIEQDVEAYKKDNNLTDIATEVQLFLASSSEYQKKAAELETQYNLIVYIEEYISKPENKTSLIPANLGVSDEALVRLIENYNASLLKRMKLLRTTNEHNPVIEQLDDQINVVRNNIISSINSLKEGINISRRDVANKDEMFLKRMQSVPTQEREYIEIKRQQKITETLYIFLYQKREENALALINNIQPAKIVDKAACLPTPVAPRKKVLLALCMLLGVFFPIGIFFILDIISNNINSVSDFKREVKVPLIGQISQERAKTLLGRKANKDEVREEFRFLRTHIDYLQSGAKGKPVILVTSSQEGEGKTFVAKNLAMVYAQAHKCVCLVDLNLRNPQIRQYATSHSNYHLADYLYNESVEAKDVIQKTSLHENLDCVTMHAGDVEGDVLSLKRLDALFTSLSDEYDVIVIDSAPLGMICDTFTLNRLANITLMVSRMHQSPKACVKFINELYASERMSPMYCVVNGIDSSTQYKGSFLS